MAIWLDSAQIIQIKLYLFNIYKQYWTAKYSIYHTSPLIYRDIAVPGSEYIRGWHIFEN